MELNEIKSVSEYDARMDAALRLFCHHDRDHAYFHPFKDSSTGNCYATDGRMAVRFVAARLFTLVNHVTEEGLKNHVRNMEMCFNIEYVRNHVSMANVVDAAEIALATVHREVGYCDCDIIDGEASVYDNGELALVLIPNVGVYRADYLVAADRALNLLRKGCDVTIGHAACAGTPSANILRIDSRDGCVNVLISGVHRGILENDMVVINSDTLARMSSEEAYNEWRV